MPRAGAGSALVVVGLLATSGLATPPEPASLVVAQYPLTPTPPAVAGGTLRGGFGEGGRIVVVDPGGATRVLSDGFHAAADPDVSFDGTRVLFAGRKQPDDPWCVWEIGVDGSGAREVTCGPGQARRPIYLPTMYTLNPTNTDAWDQVAFVGTLPGETNESGAGPHTALFTCTWDGERLRRISFNLSSDFDPALLPDGRLVFASWQHRLPGHGPRGRVALFASHVDGVDAMLFAADEGRRVKQMPAHAGARLVVFVEGEEIAADGGGSLASVSLRRNLHSYRSLSEPGDGLFHTPSAHPGGGVLVSWRSEVGQYGVYRLDPASGERAPVFDDPGWHDVQAQALAPRPLPDRRSSSYRDGESEGGLYALDVSISDLGRDAFPPGTARRLRVLEGVALEAGSAPDARAARRLLGEVDLAEDGSFHVRVPANTPLELQLLDEDGLSLRSCGWIWVRDAEQRGCVGCHEDPERTPPNRFALALGAEPPTLTPSPDERRSPTFERDVGPIVTRRCLACHGAGGATPRLDLDPRAALADAVRPGQARRSPLAWHLMGRSTLRPWDAGGAGDPALVPEGIAIDPEELRTVLEWIDLGAAWSGGEP